ncbi:nSTAND1 domain-containing NTPase [Lentzea sp. NPDC054927]
MAQVFVSYASADLMLAAELHDWLESDGHDVFLDRDPRNGIAVGDEWVHRLHERLRWAHALVCVITEDYGNSAWCTAELNTARLLGTRILPLRSGDVRHPLLDDVQHTDLTDRAVARERTARALKEIDDAGDPRWPDGRSPFPGLVPLDVDRHRVFFGREREVAELVELIGRDQGATLVVGPSGCGKSSLVRAGLIPAMTGVPGVFPLPVVVPGHDPAAALDHVLAQPVPQRPLLVIDQLEEVFTLSDADGRAEFARRLHATDAHVVCTIRPEYLSALLSDPHLSDLCKHVYPVTPLRPEALRQIVERPAAIAGITVDEPLTTRMIEDTGDGTALPLLAFTLAELSDGVRRGGKLSATRYDALGGVRGALVKEADAALKASSSSERAVLTALLSLVTVDERGQPTRRHVDRALPELTEFVARRLLTTDTIAGEVVIGVAHEAFLTEWPPLADAITEHAAALRTRRAVEHAAEQWRTAGRVPSRLWQGAHLHAAREDVTGRVDLSTTADDFLRASVRHDRRRRTRIVTVLSVLLVMALTAAAVAYNRQLIAQDRQAEAEQRERVALAQQLVATADTLLDAKPAWSLRFAVAANRLDPTNNATLAVLVHVLTTTDYLRHLPEQVELVYAHRTPLLASVSYDGEVTVWGGERHRLRVPGMRLSTIAFSPDDRLLAAAADNGTAVLWDLTGATPRLTGPHLAGRHKDISDLAFTPDGKTLVTAGSGTVQLWDVAESGRAGPTLRDLDTSSVAVNPAGTILATRDALWKMSGQEQPRRLSDLPGRDDPLYSLAFSPDGKLLAGKNQGGETLLIDVTDPLRPLLRHTIPGTPAGTRRLAFSPDGRALATGGPDGVPLIWDNSGPGAPRLFDDLPHGHTGPVQSMSFSPDGRSFATAEAGNGVVWDLTGRFRPTPVGKPFGGGVASMAFSPNGTMLATGGDDRATLWSLNDPSAPRAVGDPLTGISPHRPTDVAFAPDGRTLAAGRTLQDVTDPARPRQIHQMADSTGQAKFSPDGELLATVGQDTGKVTLWKARDPAFRVTRLHGLSVATIAFSPDSRLVVGDGNGVWEVGGRGPMLSTSGRKESATAGTFSADGHVLVTVGSTGNVWHMPDLSSSKRLGQPIPDLARAAFSPRGRLLATASADGTVTLWDLSAPESPRKLGNPLPHRATGPLVFSPDGALLATADQRDGVRLWDVRALNSLLDKPLEFACEVVGRGMSEAEWELEVPGIPYRETCP